MYKSDREIKDFATKMDIVHACRVCDVAVVDGNMPYVTPMNFGAEVVDGALVLYFHGATEGKRLAALQQNDAVCVAMHTNGGLGDNENPGAITYWFDSIVASGRMEVLQDDAEKRHGMEVFIMHQTGRQENIAHINLQNTIVYRLVAQTVTGKCHAKGRA